MQIFRRRNLEDNLKGDRSEDDTRKRILEAALRLFADRGYDRTTTKDRSSM